MRCTVGEQRFSTVSQAKSLAPDQTALGEASAPSGPGAKGSFAHREVQRRTRAQPPRTGALRCPEGSKSSS